MEQIRACLYVCMYVCMVITYSKGKDLPGKVANPARGQLNRENEFSPSPFAPENLVSRDGFGSPVPRQPAHLHTQAEYLGMIRTLQEGRIVCSQSTLPLFRYVVLRKGIRVLSPGGNIVEEGAHLEPRRRWEQHR